MKNQTTTKTTARTINPKASKTPAPAITQQASNKFETLKRNFEVEYSKGGDYSTALTALATALAVSCVNKCLDPQRKTAPERDTVSDNGSNPAMVALKRGIYTDNKLLANTSTAAANATKIKYNKDGYLVTDINDSAANFALNDLLCDTLTDGIDLVNTAAMALLEQAAAHASGEKWLDAPYTIRRLSKKVYIQAGESAAYREVETTPIQEAFRAVRREIQSSRAVQINPRNGYTYIDSLTPDGLDTIFYRLQKWADIGGYNSDGLYTADAEIVKDYYTAKAELSLTDNQEVIVNLRMRGYGIKAIATYLGVKTGTVKRILERIRARAEKIGFTPSFWEDMTGRRVGVDANETDGETVKVTSPYASFTIDGKAYTTAPQKA